MAAVDSCDKVKSHFPVIPDGNGSAPVSYPCFQLTKQSFGDADKHCSLDVLPLLIEEASHPMGKEYTLDNAHGQDVCTISVLPDEGNTSPQCASQFTLLSFIKALLPSKSHMFVDAQLNCLKTQNCINVLLEGADAYGSCLVDINVEKGNSETVKPHEEVVGSMKTESIHMQKVLQRQASLNTGEIVLQRQASLNTDKAISERPHDAPTNRWRRYKRAASFDSRKIVILFSVLSSVGTLVLIYLTLRVKQTSEEFNNI